MYPSPIVDIEILPTSVKPVTLHVFYKASTAHVLVLTWEWMLVLPEGRSLAHRTGTCSGSRAAPP